jgi:eukaryotic-like serine/threonine-protein kinase
MMELPVNGEVERDAPDRWIGRVIDDRYVVGCRIGHGATTSIYRGVQRSLDRLVTIKLPWPAGGRHRGFVDEARLLALVAPWTPSVIDVGTTRAGVPFLVTEVVEGFTLEEILRRDGALAVPRALRVALDLCGFLTLAQELSIVHRDLAPANVMLAKDRALGESAKVIDFGLGIRHDRASKRIIRPPPGRLGTPAYLAPETIAGEAASPASDVYSLGCLLFEMVTGRPPFSGSLAEVLSQQLYDRPPRLPVRRVSPGVESLLATLLRRDPVLRPTAAEAAEVLAQFAPEATARPVPSRSRSGSSSGRRR